jgi:hypothetical protein
VKLNTRSGSVGYRTHTCAAGKAAAKARVPGPVPQPRSATRSVRRPCGCEAGNQRAACKRTLEFKEPFVFIDSCGVITS